MPDRLGTSVEDRAVAPPRVIGAIRGDGLDRLVRRDLRQQLPASRGLSPCRLEVNSTARTSPVPASMAIWTFLHCLRRKEPCLRASHSHSSGLRGATGATVLPYPRNLMPVLSIRRFSGCPGARYGICTAIRAWRRHSVEKSGTGQSSPAIRTRLSTNPTVWRSGRPKRIFSVRQVWIAASEKVSGRPRLPDFSARRAHSGRTTPVCEQIRP